MQLHAIACNRNAPCRTGAIARPLQTVPLSPSACGVWHIGRPVRDPTPNKVFAQVIRREGAANGG